MEKEFNLHEEERSGHVVTREVKKLWKTQLELLSVLEDLCKKYNIKYYAGGGTLLGAVRHKGFIPWDDDLDVCMLPEDYKKFCKIALNELKESGEYFFQNFMTEEGFTPAFSRLRKSNTTACTEFEWNHNTENYNYGIFIDIFPLYYIYDSKINRFFQKAYISLIKKIVIGHEKYQYKCNRKKKGFKYIFSRSILLWKICRIFMNYNELCEWFVNACSRCHSSRQVGLISFLGFQNKYCWDSEWWKGDLTLPFENIEINIPKEYDKILRRQYRNYMYFEKNTAIHSMKIFDADTPYKVKLEKHFKEIRY